jgi:hypothetical protein
VGVIVRQLYDPTDDQVDSGKTPVERFTDHRATDED